MTPDQIHRILEQLPQLCLDLAQGHIDGPQRAARPTRNPGSKAPVNLDRVLALSTRQHIRDLQHHHQLWIINNQGELTEPRQGILPTLHLWARMLEADHFDRAPEPPAEFPHPPTVANLCTWLTRHDHLWLDAPEWDIYARDIKQLGRWAKRLVGWKPEPACPTCGTPFIRHSETLWACRHCGQEISTRVAGVTLDTGHKLTGVPVRTLRDWSRRKGVLAPLVDEDGHELRDRYGARLYDLDTIRHLAEEWETRRLA